MFQNHVRKKKECYERLAMVFYEELENVQQWEQRIHIDKRPHTDFKISDNMDLFEREYVDKVINRYIDYEFLDFSIKRLCDTPVSYFFRFQNFDRN
jgi:hypothetical protein